MKGDGKPHRDDANVIVVDDDALVLGVLRRTLTRAGYRVTGYDDPVSFLAEARLDPPCCVLLDFQMPGMTGIEVQARLARAEPPPSVVLMSGGAEIRTSVTAMKAGAVDFLEKPFQSADLLAAVDSGVRQARDRLEAWEAAREARALLARLTQREREVCALVAKGLSSKDIAGALGAAVKTVNVHRGRIREKLGTRSPVELAAMVARAGG